MADNITIGYRTGVIDLTYGAYQPSGTVRTAAGTALTEVGTTGYYKASAAAIVAGDSVIVKEGTSVVAWGEYLPNVSSSSITADLTDIEGKIDDLIIDQNKVTNIYPLESQIPTLQVF